MSGLLPRESPTSGPGSSASYDFLTVGGLIVNGVAALNVTTSKTLTNLTDTVVSSVTAKALVTTDSAHKLTGLALTNGQLAVGSTGNAPVAAAITGPGNVAVTLGAGTIALNTVAAPTFTGNQIIIATSQTPATSADPGTQGTICWDASYLYVCVATNTWVRTPLTTW